MNGLDGRDPLKIAVLSGVIVGPGDRRRLSVVLSMPGEIGLGVPAVEVIGRADRAKTAERGAHVLMVHHREESSPAPAKPLDRGALIRADALAHVESEQPQLVEIGSVDLGQNRIRSVLRGLSVPRRHGDRSTGDLERLQLLTQQGQAVDGPVVRPGRRGGLKKNTESVRADELLLCSCRLARSEPGNYRFRAGGSAGLRRRSKSLPRRDCERYRFQELASPPVENCRSLSRVARNRHIDFPRRRSLLTPAELTVEITRSRSSYW